MDPLEPFFSSPYAPPPSMPSPRRPRLQFPPPPPYPPPGGEEAALAAPSQPSLYQDQAGNIVVIDEIGVNNLAVCLDEELAFNGQMFNEQMFNEQLFNEQMFNERRFSPFKFNDETFSCKTSHKVLFNEQTKLNSPRPIPAQLFLNNSAAFRRDFAANQERERRNNAMEQERRNNARRGGPDFLASPFGGAKKPNDFGRVRLAPPTKPEHFNARAADDFEPDAYSYAYYEPGPSSTPVEPERLAGARRSRESRHTYTTRNGVEENIYEEISEVAALASKLHEAEALKQAQLQEAEAMKQSQLSLSQSVYEEEVGLVESRHRRVLGELNLAVEAMLMPPGRDEASRGATKAAPRQPDILEDLLHVGPTDDLLSPPPEDPAAGAALYQSFKRPVTVPASPGSSRYQRLERPGQAETKPGFWNKKGWRCLPKIGVIKDEPRGGLVRAWEEPGGTRRTDPLHRGLSSEESWYSGSDRDLSSDNDSEKGSVHSTKSTGQLRSTLTKARHLCDRLRPASRVEPTPGVANGVAGGVVLGGGNVGGAEGRLARWFSIRRGTQHYDVDATERSTGVGLAPLLSEAEEDLPGLTATFPRRPPPPSLPPPPPDMTPMQLKRRHIVAAIVHSENSYVATLQRLVNDYKKPLEEATPPILSSGKISTLFHRLPEILQCHTLFRIALAESVRTWDKDERLGDVFVASFSKAVVLDVYSGFINNFSAAMDLAKMESKRKSALADFLKVKQISAHDRLSFFGLMVKPVQRFPQFILFLQDLLKHTPTGHSDRMALQLALTQLESLAELLNERKREAERFQAFRETLRRLSGKFTARPLSDANRCLIREDDVTQLEFNQNGLITKSKRRRLLLLNDLVVCVSVTPRQSEDFGSAERLSLKWTVPVVDVEVVDTSGSPTLSRLMAAGLSRGGSLKAHDSVRSTTPDDLCAEMNRLMHDFEVASRIAELAATLHGSYPGLSLESARATQAEIQAAIQRKDEQMAWVDSCCLQLVVRGTKSKDDLRYTFQTDNPAAKQEWSTELRLAQLAMGVANSPAWEVPEQERRPAAKVPLFVRALAVHSSEQTTEVTCGCYFTAPPQAPTQRQRNRPQGFLWLAARDGVRSRVSVLAQTAGGALREVTAFDVDAVVTALEHVRGTVDSVWMATDKGSVSVLAAWDPERREALGMAEPGQPITSLRHHAGAVFAALADGTLLRFDQEGGGFGLANPHVLRLGTEPVSCLMPIGSALYAACGKKVWVLDGETGDISKSFTTQHEHLGNVSIMAHSGVGLWVALENSSTVCLYHTETFKHLQDINIASNVLRVASNPDCDDCAVTVTALLACKGLLWVGTNVGVGLTIPLPRLEGVPIISGRVNISYHAHFGPVTFLLALQPRTCYSRPVEEKSEAAKTGENVATKLKLTGSPVVLRRRSKTKEDDRRTSKTLPRGLGAGVLSTSTLSSQGSGECDVYGLYGELMYVKDYEDHDNVDPDYESLRRSDPDLAAIPGKVSTLDRRLKMKVSRPRSLDLSNWSVDSRASSACTSSSEDANSRLVSRNNSSASTVPAEEIEVKKDVVAAKKAAAADNGRRTVITLMGGRGYVNWRQSCCAGSGSGKPNEKDAHIVVWEMKL